MASNAGIAAEYKGSLIEFFFHIYIPPSLRPSVSAPPPPPLCPSTSLLDARARHRRRKPRVAADGAPRGAGRHLADHGPGHPQLRQNVSSIRARRGSITHGVARSRPPSRALGGPGAFAPAR